MSPPHPARASSRAKCSAAISRCRPTKPHSVEGPSASVSSRRPQSVGDTMATALAGPMLLPPPDRRRQEHAVSPCAGRSSVSRVGEARHESSPFRSGRGLVIHGRRCNKQAGYESPSINGVTTGPARIEGGGGQPPGDPPAPLSGSSPAPLGGSGTSLARRALYFCLEGGRR